MNYIVNAYARHPGNMPDAAEYLPMQDVPIRLRQALPTPRKAEYPELTTYRAAQECRTMSALAFQKVGFDVLAEDSRNSRGSRDVEKESKEATFGF